MKSLHYNAKSRITYFATCEIENLETFTRNNDCLNKLHTMIDQSVLNGFDKLIISFLKN